MPKDPSEFEASEYELEILARHVLRLFLEKDCGGFLSGHYSGSSVGYCANRFEQLSDYIDEKTKQTIIDETDEHFHNIHGDSWECYKMKFEPGFFSTSADEEAIRRVVKRLPQMDGDEDDYWEMVGNTYSLDYAQVLRESWDAN